MLLKALALLGALVLAGSQAPAPDETQVFRVTAERIQFDALFLNSRGELVTDIRPDEVTIRQEGVVVRLADLRFQSRGERTVPSVPPGAGVPAVPRATATHALVPDEPESWIFLIDDLAMSPDAFGRAKDGLLAMLERGVPPGVQIGVLRTGVLGNYTTRLSDDGPALLRSVRELRRIGNGWRGGITSRSGATVAGPTGKDRVFIEGTLGSLNSLLRDLRPLAGRKVVVVLSEMIGLTVDESEVLAKGMPTVRWNPQYNGVAGRLLRLGRLAGEAGVTVHTVDLAGVTNASATERVKQREGLHAVADELGGAYFGGSNDVGALLARVLATEQGHYVLAYEPPAGTFADGGKAAFVPISVSVSRPGITVRTRKGFFTR